MDREGQITLDVDLASEVQQLLFPKSSPVCDWCCIGVRNRMARGLGGDFFEFITMPDECQVVFIGDVTGHGLHASVVMSLLYGFIHEAAAKGCSPRETAHQANAFLRTFAKRSERLDHYFSTTLFFGVIEPRSLAMHYVNAGHVAPMVRRRDRIHRLDPTAQPLGFFDRPEIGMGEFHLQKDDRLFLFTDGIPEAFNARGKAFGLERLETILLSHRGDHLDFLDRVFTSLREFGAEDPPEDDCTSIVIDLHGPFGPI